MNERIKELAELATETVEQETEIFIEDMNIPTEWQEKFAELIVKECSLVCKMNPHFDNYQLANIVKIHFGVEE